MKSKVGRKVVPPWIQPLGSIKLAVPLLVVIAGILIGATFYESAVGSAVVQQTIYKSPWFGALMFLLAANLGVSTLSRYPWKGARKIGFAITHWGLIVIIAGSAAVIHLSVEGMLLARTDAGPVSTVRVEGDLLEVSAPGEAMQQASLFVRSDGTVVPDKVGKLSVLGYSDRAMETVRFEEGASVENPAVRLVLSSNRMNQSLERWLAVSPAVYDQMDIGPAELQIVSARTVDEREAFLTVPSEQSAGGTWGRLAVSWQGQSRLVDVEASLSEAAAAGMADISAEIAASGSAKSVTELKSSGELLRLEVIDFWPDFRLDEDRQPSSASTQMRNPAVQLLLSQGRSSETWFIFGNPNFEPIRNQMMGEPIDVEINYDSSVETTPSAFFKVVVDANGDLYYAAKSSGGFKAGPLRLGESVTPGWADFTVTLAERVSRAQVKREVVPVPEGLPVEGNPALLVATEGDDPVWVSWGQPTTISSSQGDWYVAFSPKLLPLPFSLKLNDFIVERNEGSESVAMWTSAISLLDPFARRAEDTRVDRRVWMNHPTWFKGWKIAQASWNPGDLSQSTLQIKREPWWVTGLTWLGSMMVTTGVAIMFYGRAVAKKFGKLSALLESEEKAEESGTIPLLGVFLGR
ncbi:MAG: cytochrome c biogenesis protein ResB [Cyanobacteria bacterium P01_D01_bin.105]